MTADDSGLSYSDITLSSASFRDGSIAPFDDRHGRIAAGSEASQLDVRESRLDRDRDTWATGTVDREAGRIDKNACGYGGIDLGWFLLDDDNIKVASCISDS